MDKWLNKSTSRLKVRQGKLCLCYPTLPELGCLLLEVNETCCRGMIMFQYLPPAVSSVWRKLLAPKLPVGIKMDLPPWLENFQADAAIVKIENLPDQAEIELAFNQLAPEQHKLLNQAVLAMAMKIVRKDGQADPSGGDTKAVSDIPTLLKLKKIGEVLVHMGQLKPRQLEDALERARANHERLGRYLVRAGLVAPDVLCRALALQSGLPMTDLSDAEISEKLISYFDSALMLRHGFIPFDEAESLVCIAAGSPLKASVLQDLEKHCGKKIELFLAEEGYVAKLLENLPENQKKARQHVRYSAALPVHYLFCNHLGNVIEDVTYEGILCNLSEGGLLIDGLATALISPDDFKRRGICLRMELGAPADPLRAFGQLRSLKENKEAIVLETQPTRWFLGVEFIEITAEQQRRLKELCVKIGAGAGKKA